MGVRPFLIGKMLKLLLFFFLAENVKVTANVIAFDI